MQLPVPSLPHSSNSAFELFRSTLRHGSEALHSDRNNSFNLPWAPGRLKKLGLNSTNTPSLSESSEDNGRVKNLGLNSNNTPSLSEFSEDKGRVEHQRGEGLQREHTCSRIFCRGNFFVLLWRSAWKHPLLA